MFRELARKKQALSREECLQILTEEKRGVLSVSGDDGYPYGVPMDHYYCPEDGKIYFHSGNAGHKLDAMRRQEKISYCVLDRGRRKEGDWALTFRSVVVFGRVEFVEDREKIYEICRRLSRKFLSDEDAIEDEVRRAGPRTVLFALVPEHMTGKTVHEA
ncbi:MAG: pyridoxamine 5'-phosphate oxidase family protein [Oscillospiraceae bacterium]|nr:pyridoxamine 5'-phosphate oxidase family protein [Oscillospiraceae bacterium]